MSNIPSGTSASAAPEHFDLVISGAGSVGATLVLALASLPQPPKILWLEAGELPFQPLPSGSLPAVAPQPISSVFDTRRLALSRTSLRFLQQLGLGSDLRQLALPIQDILVWQAQGIGRTRIQAAAEGLPELGVAITARDLGALLLSRALALPQVWVQQQTEIADWRRMTGGWRLQLRTVGGAANPALPPVVSTQFLAVAEGVASSSRAHLGIKADTYCYRQQACVFPCQVNAAFSATQAATALECFTATGSLALLPGADNVRWLIWALPEAEAAGLVSRPERVQQAIQKVFKRRLQVEDILAEPVYYDLKQVIAREQVRPHLVLLGNAAHSVHPIAGQGFNLAVRDIALFWDAARRCQLAGAVPWQEFAWLQAYAQQRQLDQWRIQQLCHGLVRGFQIPGGLAQAVRSLGLWVFDAWPAAKRYLAQSWLAPWQATQFQDAHV